MPTKVTFCNQQCETSKEEDEGGSVFETETEVETETETAKTETDEDGREKFNW